MYQTLGNTTTEKSCFSAIPLHVHKGPCIGFMVLWGAVYHSVVPQCYMLSVSTVCLGTHIKCGIGCTMMRICALAVAVAFQKLRGTQNRA